MGVRKWGACGKAAEAGISPIYLLGAWVVNFEAFSASSSSKYSFHLPTLPLLLPLRHGVPMLLSKSTGLRGSRTVGRAGIRCDDFPTVSSCETICLECTKWTMEALSVCYAWEDHIRGQLYILNSISDVKKKINCLGEMWRINQKFFKRRFLNPFT